MDNFDIAVMTFFIMSSLIILISIIFLFITLPVMSSIVFGSLFILFLIIFLLIKILTIK